MVDIRKEVAKYFDQVISENDCLVKQASPKYMENSFWGYAVYLDSKNPEREWVRFRKHPSLTRWRSILCCMEGLTYHEDYFKNEVQKYDGIWQNFDDNLCPNANFLQKRIKAFKTNYWDLKEAEQQAEILYKTLKLLNQI